jgi:hypothetical protein
LQPAVRLPVKFSVPKLRADLRSLADSNFLPVLSGEAKQGWRGAALRSPDGQATTLSDGAKNQDTPLMEKLPYLREVVSFFECELLRVRLLTQLPGAFIGEHTDLPPEDGLREARLHVPIRTNKRVEFRVGGKDIFMRPGELWYIDVSQPHSAGNGGRTPRVHLVVDCIVNDWLRNLIEA